MTLVPIEAKNAAGTADAMRPTRQQIRMRRGLLKGVGRHNRRDGTLLRVEHGWSIRSEYNPVSSRLSVLLRSAANSSAEMSYSTMRKLVPVSSRRKKKLDAPPHGLEQLESRGDAGSFASTD